MDYLTGIVTAAHGIGMTLYVTVCAILIGIVIGLLMALMKMSRHIVPKIIANVYIEVVRGTPLFVQILIFAYGIPYLVSSLSGGKISFNWEPIVIVGILACGLNSGAYLAEIMRSGIQAVDKGQNEASRSLGLTSGQTMRYVILPQAFRIILPAMANEFVTLIKETSILSYIGIVEITREGMLWASRDFKSFPAYIGVAIVYMCLTIPLSRLVAYLEKRMDPSAPKMKKRKPGI
ncbi:MAG: amino acid ABC transporter permease [Anaerovoracaceae bacterium]|jgi:His/Glu/Gln/Arg/opine family amino acid ABC transporter permease subunit